MILTNKLKQKLLHERSQKIGLLYDIMNFYSPIMIAVFGTIVGPLMEVVILLQGNYNLIYIIMFGLLLPLVFLYVMNETYDFSDIKQGFIIGKFPVHNDLRTMNREKYPINLFMISAIVFESICYLDFSYLMIINPLYFILVKIFF